MSILTFILMWFGVSCVTAVILCRGLFSKSTKVIHVCQIGFSIQPSGYFRALPLSVGLLSDPEVVFYQSDSDETPPLWLPFAMDAANRLAYMIPQGRC